MKKRSKIILIVTGVVIFILLCIAIPIVFLVYNDYGVTVGRLLVSDVGNMVNDGKTVIIMSDQSDGKDIFDGLRTGDKILVVHDGVEESLPARTGAFHIFRLAKGDESDIPEDATSSFVVKDYAYESDITEYMDKENVTVKDTKTKEYETGDLLFREWQFRDDYFEKGSYTLYKDILETQVPNLDKILFIFNGELKETFDYCGLDVVIDVPEDGICQFIAVDKDGNKEDITPVSLGEVNCVEDNGILFLN